ncbi:MAG: efflux RND transporter periplasmic adaptor subunit [Proteobacteria bacterium]|nr:efflux RND transporter periplasmic adaptor subunit [Pseudomonadota bacterium]MBU1688391.1 efflux RND transporter periplasmic adaptor subunit [Pseudomonadota bacterium]
MTENEEMNMQDTEIRPTTPRAKIVKLIWGALPSVALIGLIILIFGLFAQIKSKKTQLEEEQAKALATGRPPVNVVLLEIQPREISDRLNLPGVIEPWIDLELLSKINGAIIEVPVREGDRLTKGEVIARVDQEDYRIALDAADSAAKLAVANLDRTRSLFKKGLTPQAELDAMENQVQTTRAARDNAQLMLSRCTITAPTSGVIRRLDAKIGLQLNNGDPIARILQIDKVKGVIGIPESDVTSVARLDQVTLTLQALDNRTIIGTKYFLASSPENLARLYNLELAIDNPDRSILPGMFVKADIIKQQVPDGLSVPLYAILTRNGDRFVYIDQDGIAHRRLIELGITEDWRVQITKGLAAGDRVIVEGHRGVEEGQELNIVKVLTDNGEFDR